MLLIQQSSIFRLWTSRALMVYFRRALLFLVVSPRQDKNNNHYLLEQQQQQKVYFSDAEDDEDVLMIDNQKISTDRNENKSKQYLLKNFSHGLNKSMENFIDESFSDQTDITKSSETNISHLNLIPVQTINNIQIKDNTISDVFVNDHQVTSLYSLKQQTPINFHTEIDTLVLNDPYMNCTSSKVLNSVSFIYNNDIKAIY